MSPYYTRKFFFIFKKAMGEAWAEVSNQDISKKRPIKNIKKSYWKYDYGAWKEHFLKKYIYTINHKRIGLSYLYFCLFSGLAGAMLATFIRLELSYPGSHFFKGDSVRYIQVITAHGLIMIFYVVVPVVFGLFANYFIPYHILSKDVAFPRLNSIGFWLLPAGFLLMSRPAFTRRQVYKN
jgi:heme/copper-type cytochrome/quinol oxidase subunit 1